jgi:hypothetical protein
MITDSGMLMGEVLQSSRRPDVEEVERDLPRRAVDIARDLGSPGNLRDRTQIVRAELRNCKAFVDVSRGRWQLGRPSGYERASLSSAEMVDYLDRLHKDTRRTWTTTGDQR